MISQRIQTTSATAPGASRVKPRLQFLDGLRALASLYVLLFHEASVKVVGHGQPSWVMSLVLPRSSRGRYGVVFFIVLSGFSLMLPIAREGSLNLVGGFRNYLHRRARRILPPYYAALAMSLLSIVLYNRIEAAHGGGQPIEAAIKAGSVVSHLLLVHNLSLEWVYRINSPMWTVATEWQIYFVFPALLLPLWRCAGGVVTVALAWGIGSLPFFLLSRQSNFFWASPWFVGSFALGMSGAVIAFSPLRDRIPWRGLAALSFGVLVIICAAGWADSWGYPNFGDLVVSILAFCWINACVRHSAAGSKRGGHLLRLLESRALVYLGGFSYSLYLIQYPIIQIFEKLMNQLHFSYDASVALPVLFGTPIIVALAWVFSEFFERPFTKGALLLPALQRRFRASLYGSS